MALFKKKKRETPEPIDTPKNPDFPRLPPLQGENHGFSQFGPPRQEIEENAPKMTRPIGLPPFPNSDQDIPTPETIKPSPMPQKMPMTQPSLPPTPPIRRPMPRPAFQPGKETLPMPPSIQPHPPLLKEETKKIQDLYVRIDKFKFALENFKKIQEKMSEIEGLLRKIKEDKKKEDQELTEWEREIEIIKARLDEIDKNIFSKMG